MNTLNNKTKINRSVLLNVQGCFEDLLWTPVQDSVFTYCADKVMIIIYEDVLTQVRAAVRDYHKGFKV